MKFSLFRNQMWELEKTLPCRSLLVSVTETSNRNRPMRGREHMTTLIRNCFLIVTKRGAILAKNFEFISICMMGMFLWSYELLFTNLWVQKILWWYDDDLNLRWIDRKATRFFLISLKNYSNKILYCRIRNNGKYIFWIILYVAKNLLVIWVSFANSLDSGCVIFAKFLGKLKKSLKN